MPPITTRDDPLCGTKRLPQPDALMFSCLAIPCDDCFRVLGCDMNAPQLKWFRSYADQSSATKDLERLGIFSPTEAGEYTKHVGALGIIGEAKTKVSALVAAGYVLIVDGGPH